MNARRAPKNRQLRRGLVAIARRRLRTAHVAQFRSSGVREHEPLHSTTKSRRSIGQ